MNFWELSKVQNKLFELFNYGLLHELNDAINKKKLRKKTMSMENPKRSPYE